MIFHRHSRGASASTNEAARGRKKKTKKFAYVVGVTGCDMTEERGMEVV